MATRLFSSGGFSAARAAVCALALAAATSVASAQQAAQPPAPPPAAQQQSGFFGAIAAWWDRQTSNWQAAWQGMDREVENFGREASAVAKTSAGNAKQAAEAVGKIRNTTIVAGNTKCTIAPNGAPDCIAAANTMCKAKGFASGQSLDMTTAEDCPTKVYISGRSTGPECSSYTFVSRALCQ
jgi:opacity protein-like surface antigen